MTVPDKKYPSIFGKQMLVAGMNNTAVKITSDTKNIKCTGMVKKWGLGCVIQYMGCIWP